MSAPTITIKHHSVRTRILVTIQETETGKVVSQDIIVGEATDVLPNLRPQKYEIGIGMLQSLATSFTISLRKLSTAEPFGPGIATHFFKPSTFEFFGVDLNNVQLVNAPKPAEHRIQFLGASDTAGYCVDGTTETSFIQEGILGWRYENCDSGYVSLVGQSLDADIEVFAISGIGLTQNARMKQQWQLGPLPLPGFYNRTMESDKSEETVWDPARFEPELVVISLGGNDYNH